MNAKRNQHETKRRHRPTVPIPPPRFAVVSRVIPIFLFPSLAVVDWASSLSLFFWFYRCRSSNLRLCFNHITELPPNWLLNSFVVVKRWCCCDLQCRNDDWIGYRQGRHHSGRNERRTILLTEDPHQKFHIQGFNQYRQSIVGASIQNELQITFTLHPSSATTASVIHEWSFKR